MIYRGNKRKTEKSDGYVEMKRMALTERGRGSGWQEPARGLKTNDDDDDDDGDDDDDDDDDANIVLFCCYIDKKHKTTNTVLILDNVDRAKCYYYCILNCYYYKLRYYL